MLNFKYYILIGVMGFGCFMPVSILNAKTDSPWDGLWQDADGGMMSIRQQVRHLEIAGKDKSSIYTAQCLVDKSFITAKCLGSGTQITTGKKFLYQTQWRLESGKIVEKWTAEFEDELLTGDLIFNRSKVNH